MNRDGKEENPASIRCLTMLLRCLQDSSTVPLRLMPAALRFTPMELRMIKNAHDAHTKLCRGNLARELMQFFPSNKPNRIKRLFPRCSLR